MRTVCRWYLFASLLFLYGLASGAVYPVKISSSNWRVMVDQNNVPFLMVGDSPQSLVVNLSQSDASSYIVDRRKHGFNTLLMDVVCTTYTAGPANASLLNGTLPFTNTISGGYYDLTTPNPAYFSYVDQIVNLCASNGIEVMLDPIETGGWLATMLANGTGRCRAYGQYLGNRYRNFPNIIWSNGNDFQNWSTPTDDAVVMAVALGIMDYDTNHLQTIELSYSASSSLDDPNWAPIVGLNAAYTYFPTYVEVLHAYNQSTNTPVFLTEANYEFESLAGPVTTAPILRKQEYWTLLSGGVAGQLYGNHYTWTFASGWQTNLDTPGVVELGYVTSLFAPRAWYNLLPDTNHLVVTAGYGTYTSSGYVADNNYLTAASTPDGTLAIAYMPTVRTVTVNLAEFSVAVTAQWYDPSSGSYLPIAGSPFSNAGTRNFTPPGNNTDGDGGWVLVLETAPPTLSISVASTNTAVIAWPGYVLQQSPNLATTNWVNATNVIMVVNNEYQVVISPLAGQRFYRLESGIGRPSLGIFLTATNTAVVAWPGYVLQQNSNLMKASWVNATNAITVVSNEYQVNISPLVGQQFYRLMYP